MAQGNLSNHSLASLQSELKRRERQVKSLLKKRDKLVGQLKSLEDEIEECGADLDASMLDAGVARPRKRPRNDQKLADALVEVLRTTTLSVTEVAEAVQDAGYKTTSPNFRTIVNQTLLKDPRFRKVSRGRYTARAASPASSSRRKKPSTRKSSRKA